MEKNKNSMGEYQLALKNIKTVNPSGQHLMLWNEDNKKKKELINLFENYVFILRSSYVVSFDSYLSELNNTIDLIEDNIEETIQIKFYSVVNLTLKPYTYEEIFN